MKTTPFDLAAINGLLWRLARAGDLPERLAEVHLTRETLIDELNLDSLAMLTLLQEIETETGAELPDDFIRPGMSIGSIADYFSGPRK
jgi:acyl carrier protein